jgi:hypothetical protein
MAKRTDDTLMERETVIRWDETDGLATLWTASAKTRQEWDSFGFPVTEIKRAKAGTVWVAAVPKDRISYKPVRNRP